jgi:hypothetical protein
MPSASAASVRAMMKECRRALTAAAIFGGCIARVGQFLVVQMAALLRQELIFDMHRGRAGIFEAADHMHHVQRFAMARVAIHEHRQSRRARHLAG